MRGVRALCHFDERAPGKLAVPHLEARDAALAALVEYVQRAVRRRLARAEAHRLRGGPLC